MKASRHKVKNGLALDDPTYENYLRLAETIFTGKIKVVDLQDNAEAEKRMREIDELRARGEKTECEQYTNPKFKKQVGNENLGKMRTIIQVVDAKTKEKTYYTSIRELCEVNNISRETIKNRFKKSQSAKILYEGLIIKKVKQNSLETKIQPHRIHLNPNLDMDKYKTEWNDYEKAFIVQNRPQMKWKTIAAYLGRRTESCSTVFGKIKKQGKLDFYKNIDISDKFKL